MAISTPPRSYVQRTEALARANEVRTGRRELKRELKAAGRHGARTRVADLLDDYPSYLNTMKVWDLITAIPRIGSVKVNNMMWAARISPVKTVNGLSTRQRSELIRLLREERLR